MIGNNTPTVSWSLDDAVEVTLKQRDDFLKIVETLTRIGHTNKNKELLQVCHILHKRGRYYIIHFKGLLALDGNTSHCFDVEDLEIQNKVAKLVQQWGLADIVNISKVEQTEDTFIKVVPYRDKNNWTLTPQYEFGNR